eukprot:SAG22_NODE_1121_length_5508_cov_6.904234_10_plen_76_part_00
MKRKDNVFLPQLRTVGLTGVDHVDQHGDDDPEQDLGQAAPRKLGPLAVQVGTLPRRACRAFALRCIRQRRYLVVR